MTRFAFAVVGLFAASPVGAAAPRDEVLRVAPPDAAIVVVVQNGREHHRALMQSPFAEWFPTTALGKKVLESSEVKQLRESAAMIFRELDTTPASLIDDILGDTIAFAYSPPPASRPTDERAVVLIRPRKLDAIQKLIDRLNELQTKSGELKAVNRKEHAGAFYFERQKASGGADFYCYRGAVFAFSASEADIQAVIDRDKSAPADATPELVARLKRLGVADAAAVVLVNPRPLDAEVKARVAAAKPDEKRFLEKFAGVWTALDTAAVYLTLDTDIELGVSVRFQPGKLPAEAKKWLDALREPSTAEYLIPKGAIGGVAGHFRAAELVDLVASLAPVEPGKPGVKDWIDQTLGPVVGRDKLPLVLNSLGPNWAVWAEAPEKTEKDSFLPTLVAAIEIGGANEDRAKAEQALADAVGFGFRMGRFAYNASHTDQIELREEKDAKSGAVITSLVNEKGFPPGLWPSFALVKGHLVLATSPDAIKRFDVPAAGVLRNGRTTLARFSGVKAREYLTTHGPRLAKFLTELGVTGDEGRAREVLETITAALELIDTAEVISRPNENGLQLAVRVKPAKPLKK